MESNNTKGVVEAWLRKEYPALVQNWELLNNKYGAMAEIIAHYHHPSPPLERVEDAAALQQQFKKETGKDTAGSWYEQWLEDKLLEYRQAQPLTAGKWVSEKPRLTEECILITHTVFRNNHEYQAWQIVRVESEEGWYFGLCTMDGEEWGDYEDLKADHYKIVSEFTPIV